MTVSSVPKFFGFSVISDGYKLPDDKADCITLFGSNGDYENLRKTLAEKLAEIFNPTNPTNPSFPIKGSEFYKEICKDICDDSVESNIAYKFYVNQIVKKIDELDSYIKEAQELLKEENYTDNKLTRLQLLDTFCKKIEIEFSHYYSYDPEEDVFKVIEEESSAPDYAGTQLQDLDGEKKDTYNYQDLRDDKVFADVKPGQERGNKGNTKTIECFNELNLLDRLKYIKLYYDCNSGKTDALFPNDKPEEAYPAVSVPKSTDYNKETYTTGQLELFYIGYLVDRDGPIGALCSFIEFKSLSLLKNIEIESLRIKAINAYLAYLTQASMSLNGRGKDAGVPEQTYGIVSLICGGFARGIRQLNINEETHDYIVLQTDFPENTIGENGYHLSKTGYYILVRVDAGISDKVYHHADSPFIEDRIGEDNRGDQVNNIIKDPSTGEFFPRVSFFQGFTYSTFDSTGSNDFLLAHISDNENHKAFLPKELDITTINMESIYGYKGDDIAWNSSKTDENKESHARMINAWQDAIDSYEGNLNTSLESINSDIDVWRSKMNTWDALANKIRHRDYEIRQNLMSRALR